jgi:polysaccharide pyruvyl transferase WcaK-like protein
MKKIASITFHWAANYGAVLQAFALQKFLKNKGFDTEIIDYIPFRTWVISCLMSIKKRDFSYFEKLWSFRKFKKENLIVSKKKYFNNKSLFKSGNDYSAVVCGSDQIWNKAFTTRAEGKPTLSYFLNFAGENTKRISYATSFGATKLDKETVDIFKDELQKFSAISVRENTAKQILSNIGIESKVVVDPTLLLEEKDYSFLLKNKNYGSESDVLTYIIHSNQTQANEINDYVVKKYNNSNYIIKDCDIYEWLARIKNSKIVVTNSFHGTVFSLIFHKPFITVAVPGSGMNDRLTTLLSSLGLSERFLDDFNKETIDELIEKDINWQEVDKKINDLRGLSAEFLLEALN